MNKPMTHEEILLYWHKYGGTWYRVVAYKKDEYCLGGVVWFEKKYFNFETACIIPPEVK